MNVTVPSCDICFEILSESITNVCVPETSVNLTVTCWPALAVIVSPSKKKLPAFMEVLKGVGSGSVGVEVVEDPVADPELVEGVEGFVAMFPLTVVVDAPVADPVAVEGVAVSVFGVAELVSVSTFVDDVDEHPNPASKRRPNPNNSFFIFSF